MISEAKAQFWLLSLPLTGDTKRNRGRKTFNNYKRPLEGFWKGERRCLSRLQVLNSFQNKHKCWHVQVSGAGEQRCQLQRVPAEPGSWGGSLQQPPHGAGLRFRTPWGFVCCSAAFPSQLPCRCNKGVGCCGRRVLPPPLVLWSVVVLQSGS